ncbi:MAG: hypothetical protein V7603_1282 [Micromonosporaceae bacterium]
MLPGLRRLWRDAHSLQLGTDPARAVVLEFADPSTARMLDLLDGSRNARMILRDASRLGVPEPAATLLLDLLRDAGLAVGAHTLMPAGLPEPLRRRLSTEVAALALRPGAAPASPAETVRRRISARVLVSGHGRLVAPITAALAEAGVGHVDPALTGRVRIDDAVLGGMLPTDTGRPRAVAAAEAVVRVAPSTNLRPLRDGSATFVVQAGGYRPPELAALAYARRGVAHLTIELRDGTVVIGPLVPPAGSPCLNCVDLHRRDRDPAWPALVAQLATGGDAALPCAVTTALVATGYAADEVLRFVDGREPQTIGTTIEISGPGRERRRRWSPHPRCGCGQRRRRGQSPGG